MPDKAAAARQVLRDWTAGRVPYFSAPPADDAHLQPFAGAAAVVASFGAAFDPAQLAHADALVLDAPGGGGGGAGGAVGYILALEWAPEAHGSGEAAAAAILGGTEGMDDDFSKLT